MSGKQLLTKESMKRNVCNDAVYLPNAIQVLSELTDAISQSFRIKDRADYSVHQRSLSFDFPLCTVQTYIVLPQNDIISQIYISRTISLIKLVVFCLSLIHFNDILYVKKKNRYIVIKIYI